MTTGMHICHYCHASQNNSGARVSAPFAPVMPIFGMQQLIYVCDRKPCVDTARKEGYKYRVDLRPKGKW